MMFLLTMTGLVLFVILMTLGILATHAGRVWDENQQNLTP